MVSLLELATTEIKTGVNNLLVSERGKYQLHQARVRAGQAAGIDVESARRVGEKALNFLASLGRDESEGLAHDYPNTQQTEYFYGPKVFEGTTSAEMGFPDGLSGTLYYEKWEIRSSSDQSYIPAEVDIVTPFTIEDRPNSSHSFNLVALYAGGSARLSWTNFFDQFYYNNYPRNFRLVVEGDPFLFPGGNPPPGVPYPLCIANDCGTVTFGTPYIDSNGDLRVPFQGEGDAWAMNGSFNASKGTANFGGGAAGGGGAGNNWGDNGETDPRYPPIGEGNQPDNDSCVKLRICGETDSDSNSWPITVPDLLTQSDDATYDITSLPQAIAWFARNVDAISGQYPITLEIEDTDPITRGNQSQTINLPNQAEAMAELFGMAYEANTNSELMVNMLFRLIPEVIAAKNSSLTSQDYTQAITNWLGFRTKNVQREIDSNFNPLSPESLVDFLGASKYKIQGVEDDDPHTLVEWVQQFKYAAGLVKASLFRGPDLEGQLSAEMEEVINNQPKDSAEAWEKFIDALNRQESNLTDRTVAPRPRATSVDDVLDIGTVLPGPDPD